MHDRAYGPESAILGHALTTALCASQTPDLKAIVWTAIETGLRRGELLNLRWTRIDLQTATAEIPITKKGVPRTIPLTPRAVGILRSLSQRDDLVFNTSANAVKLAWKRVLHKACITDLRFHDLRYEAVSRFFESGLSLPEVAVISGHKDVRMLMRYTHLDPAKLPQKLAVMTDDGEWSCRPAHAISSLNNL